MPLKNDRLTPRERVFAERYAVTGDAPYAAEKAGYAVPASGASQNLRKPIVLKEVRRQQMVRLQNEIVPLALDHATTVLSDPKRPDREKTLVMKVVLDHAHKLKGEEDVLEPHEMCGEELRRRANEAYQMIVQWRAEVAQRAVDVTPEPIAPASVPLIEHKEDIFG